jgi:hypothetical protein
VTRTRRAHRPQAGRPGPTGAGGAARASDHGSTATSSLRSRTRQLMTVSADHARATRKPVKPCTRCKHPALDIFSAVNLPRFLPLAPLFSARIVQSLLHPTWGIVRLDNITFCFRSHILATGLRFFTCSSKSSAPALPFPRGIGRRLVVCRLFPLHLLCGVSCHLFLAELVVSRFSRQIAHFVNAPLPRRLDGRCPWKSLPNIQLSISPN